MVFRGYAFFLSWMTAAHRRCGAYHSWHLSLRKHGYFSDGTLVIVKNPWRSAQIITKRLMLLCSSYACFEINGELHKLDDSLASSYDELQHGLIT